jgi:NAD(P)-dependent dehydrogenase (short-subunit alcohol dehydrogenase family)
MLLADKNAVIYGAAGAIVARAFAAEGATVFLTGPPAFRPTTQGRLSGFQAGPLRQAPGPGDRRANGFQVGLGPTPYGQPAIWPPPVQT